MKCLIDASQIARGGAVQVALAMITKAAADPNHEWHVAVSGELSAEISDALGGRLADLIRLPRRRNSFERMMVPRRYMPGVERAAKPDVVFTIFGPAYWHAKAPHLVGFALPRMIYPELEHVGKDHQPPWWRARLRGFIDGIRRRQFHRPDYLVVETETVRTRLEQCFGIQPDRVIVVPNSFSPIFADEIAKLTVSPPNDRFRIAVPSSFYPHKNLGLIPPTAAKLRDQLDRPFEFCFTLPEQSPGWQDLAAKAEALGVAQYLTTRGALPHGEIARLYRESHVVFLPTLLECSTAVYPETFCAGIPLVTSDRDFARELCGGGARFIDPHSPDSAAEALAEVLSNPKVADQLVGNARQILPLHYPNPDQKWQAQLAAIYRACGQTPPAA
ncbi:glycosyltransferase family 4 protein [Acanthopleuribacter pedis]|uniref:Glycosyltransferase family 4 protein n=1 Tax=Acanthopleuribacter pedis TaxID=442870 RepID=A0A8J7Q0C6_9BACT|nr:glycosyltransferase family 4 protein [Acanthopleuribacter pedis]MBO1316920.1 glycosyltransferase family 4 protein [Acanthopleuribacter pedis]